MFISRAPNATAHVAGKTFRRSISRVRIIEEPFDRVAVGRFREATNGLTKPVALHRPKDDASLPWLPAQHKWFNHGPAMHKGGAVTDYLARLSPWVFTYELMAPQPTEGGGDAVALFLAWLSQQQENPMMKHLHDELGAMRHSLPKPLTPPSFHQFEAPLSLLLAADSFNATAPHPLRSLYIAQYPIDCLPADYAADLPTPRLVKEAGRGDVYNSSVWMGLEPTYTPLHRDPNPNLFVQLRRSKVIRMLAPAAGDALYRDVRAALGMPGNSRIRGAEMMYGPERDLLHERVWADGGAHVLEVEVGPGDAVYVPLGWWHSVRSVGGEAGLNASANWWFR